MKKVDVAVIKVLLHFVCSSYKLLTHNSACLEQVLALTFQ